MLEFKDLKRQYDTLKNEIDDAIYSVVRETNFISGKPIGRLEEELAEYVEILRWVWKWHGCTKFGFDGMGCGRRRRCFCS